LTTKAAQEAFSAALVRYAGWMRGTVLPFWAERAWDKRRGGFYEALDFQGRPVAETVRRVRVQSRQVHVFATATRLGWIGAERLAHEGFDYLLDYACPEEGERGCVHRLAPDGSILDSKRDLYDQAFVLLACAAMIRAFKESRAPALAQKALAFLDRELASSQGGYLEDDAKTLPRRQNPHMHLFEACMALHEAAPEGGFLQRANGVFALFEARFFDAPAGVLREFFTASWKLDEARGDVLEPGHMAEWAWLLERRARLQGRLDANMQGLLFKNAEALGADGSGFLVDETRIGRAAGGPRRLWPQTEYLKACIVLAKKGDEGAMRTGAELVDRLFATYLNEPVSGLWCDRFDGSGARMAQDVPASILYHLFDAAVEAQVFLDHA
jgi:mannose-6-phosphate isomerase